jgi:hypothetical protein
MSKIGTIDEKKKSFHILNELNPEDIRHTKPEKEMQRNRNETLKTNMLSMLEKAHCITERK